MSIFFNHKIMAELSIPSSEFPILAKIVDLDEGKFSEFLKVLGETTPPLGREKFISKLCLKLTKFKEDEIAKLLNSILALYRVREKLEISAIETASLVKDAANDNSKHCSLFADGRGDILEKRLSKLLALDSTLGLGTKCVLAMEENERVCLGAEITSDIRPLSADDGESINAAAINHNLKIHFRHGVDRDHSDFYITLDDNDLERIKEEIEKAQKKSLKLKAYLKQSNIFYLENE
jgi:hypothetical protein